MSLISKIFVTLAIFALSFPAMGEEPTLGEDGLYSSPWFLDSFLELKDDVEETAANGKRLAVFWELKGCPYCKETHFTNLARDDIKTFIQEHFEVLQLNIIGSRLVVDLDGEEISEKALAKKYGVRFTPTIQFLGTDVDEIASLTPREREVARLQGYLKPDDFLSMFKFVQSGAYESTTFRKYLKERRTN